MYTFETFLTWLKDFHPFIKIIFVLAKCINVFQPTDDILQRPFKHAFKNQFDDWGMVQITQQLDNTTQLKETKHNLSFCFSQ
jgi:hypothetical protein